MSWSCVCNKANEDEVLQCINCGRKKPKYLGVKLEVSTDKMEAEQKAVWYLKIAFDCLQDAQNTYVYHEKERTFIHDIKNEEVKGAKNSIVTNCNRCFTMVDKAIQFAPNPQFQDSDNRIQDTASIKSACYFLLGQLHFDLKDYGEAIKYYQNSYDADPNQVSIYNIAMATIQLPVEGTSLFGGKKNEIAKENKRQQEIDLLVKTIKFLPFSDIAIKSGRILIEKYGLEDIEI